MLSSPAPKDPTRQVNPWMEANCPCPRDCPRHGNCFECLANHRDNYEDLAPACIRQKLSALKKKQDA